MASAPSLLLAARESTRRQRQRRRRKKKECDDGTMMRKPFLLSLEQKKKKKESEKKNFVREGKEKKRKEKRDHPPAHSRDAPLFSETHDKPANRFHFSSFTAFSFQKKKKKYSSLLLPSRGAREERTCVVPASAFLERRGPRRPDPRQDLAEQSLREEMGGSSSPEQPGPSREVA